MFPDGTPRYGLLEPGQDSGWRAGHCCGACEPSLDVGCDGNPGGLPEARGLAFRRTRALHGTSADEGELEVPSNSHPPTMGTSVSLPGWCFEMGRNLVVEVGYDSSRASAAQQMQDQR